MPYKYISVFLGRFFIYYNDIISDKTPIVFLHGIYFDHSIWNDQINRFHDRLCISIDMPLHGESRDISKYTWTLEDCSRILLEILDKLYISEVFAIGQSWGAMTIINAALKYPKRFSGVAICDVPLKRLSYWNKLHFNIQYLSLMNRIIFIKTISRQLFDEKNLDKYNKNLKILEGTIAKLNYADIIYINKIARIDFLDLVSKIKKLKIEVHILVSERENIFISERVKIHRVKGSFVNPLEEPDAVSSMIENLLK